MNPATALATVLVDELARGGVEEAVLSPGSRSTPLALALHAHPGIRLHVRIDERSAGFCALGLAAVSARPVPVVCTSGSAAANLHPAVVEADHSGHSLLVLTADRPPELHGTGASQTMDQTRLYGQAVRMFIDVGVPETRVGMVRYWRSVACHAIAAARTGPVHLNVPLRKPLVPDGDTTWPESLDGRAGGAPWTETCDVEPARPDLDVPERGIVVTGASGFDPVAVVAFAEAAGWPILAEPQSNARRGPNAISAYAWLLAQPRFTAGLRPDMIVTVGRPTLRAGLPPDFADVPQIVVDPGVLSGRWPDPERRAARVLPILPVPRPAETSARWLKDWQDADATVRTVLDAALDEMDGPGELRSARDIVAGIPPDSLLFAGASTPVRSLDLAAPPRSDLLVLSNRGVSGIDGAVSLSLGAALAHQRRGGGHAYALLGDLTALHDQNGLLLGQEEERPGLTIVVVNNKGGGIFRSLPGIGGGSGFRRLFTTPLEVELENVAATAGWDFRRVTESTDLLPALAPEPGTTRLVEVPVDIEESVALKQKLDASIGTALFR